MLPAALLPRLDLAAAAGRLACRAPVPGDVLPVQAVESALAPADPASAHGDGVASERIERLRAASPEVSVSPLISAPSYVIAAPAHDSDEEVTEWNPVIIAESTTALKRLSVSDAVMELDMTGVPVIVFRHAGHGRVNLIYRRADGHIGWIDLPPIEQDAH